MEIAISQVRSKSVTLTKARPYLLEVGDRLPEDIIGILPGITAYSNMCLVVTPNRIVGVGPDGSVEVWHYKDLRKVRFGPGKKKLFGGYEFSFLSIDLPDGTKRIFQLNGEHDYLYRVGMFIEEVFRKAGLERL
jgi:hypothetical protein